MSSMFTITQTDEKLKIEIRPPMKFSVKLMLVMEGIGYTLGAFLLAAFSLQVSDDGLLEALYIGAIGMLYLFVSRKYINRVFSREVVEITHTQLSLLETNFSGSKQLATYPLNDSLSIRYAGQREYTPHPMHSQTLDITGLSMTEKEVQYLIEDGTLEVDDGTKTFRFGKNLASWDAEELITLLETFSGKDLHRGNNEMPAAHHDWESLSDYPHETSDTYDELTRLDPESEFTVTITDTSVKVEHPRRKAEEINWNDIMEIKIITTDAGPLSPDLWLALIGDHSGCLIPQGCLGYDEVYDTVSQYPGFQFDQVIASATSTDNREFLVWSRV